MKHIKTMSLPDCDKLIYSGGMIARQIGVMIVVDDEDLGWTQSYPIISGGQSNADGNVLCDDVMQTEMVIFNRCSLEMDLNKFRRTVKALNQQAMLAFEDENGNQLELGKEQPPYDLNADIIEVEDTDYGLLFLDMSDTPERYEGKTIRFKGKVMIPRRFPENCFIPGRNAMTCCANDIRFIGYICKSKNVAKLKQKQWVEVTAQVKYEYAREYGGEGPILYAKHLKAVNPPAEDLVYFN